MISGVKQTKQNGCNFKKWGQKYRQFIVFHSVITAVLRNLFEATSTEWLLQWRTRTDISGGNKHKFNCSKPKDISRMKTKKKTQPNIPIWETGSLKKIWHFLLEKLLKKINHWSKSLPINLLLVE